jgi:uncharacterized tellurite resistance protein B-like protein
MLRFCVSLILALNLWAQEPFGYIDLPGRPTPGNPVAAELDGNNALFRLGDGQVVLESVKFKKPWFGQWQISFNVRNRTDHTLEAVVLHFLFVDKAGQIVSDPGKAATHRIPQLAEGAQTTLPVSLTIPPDLKPEKARDVEGVKVLLGSFRARMNPSDQAAAKEKARKDEEERQTAARAAQENAEAEAQAHRDLEARQQAEAKAAMEKKAAAWKAAEAAKKKQQDAQKPKAVTPALQPKPQAQPTVTSTTQSSSESEPPILPGLLVGSGFGLAFLGLRAGYRKSDAFKALETARNSLATVQELDRRINEFQRRAREVEYLASKNHLAAVHEARLRAIPVDELRAYAPGVRIQALRDHGIRNLADLTRWPASSLTQIRGIGPDSATKIHSAASTLTTRSNQHPIPFPWPGPEPGPERPLLEAVYHKQRITEWFADPTARFPALIRDFNEHFAVVRTKTTFSKWFFSRRRDSEIQSAATIAHFMERTLIGNSESGRIYREFRQRLNDADASGRHVLLWPELRREINAQKELYKERLCHLLEISPVGIDTPPPHPIPAKPTSNLVSPLSAGGAGIKNTQTSKPSITLPWVAPGTETTICAYQIQGGMLYYKARGVSSSQAAQEPSLIDPDLPIARSSADCHIRRTGYWPSYGSISPEARASYLQWLASGKDDLQADIGYVFLYFYGLERRVLQDSPRDPDAKKDLPAIEAEITRLLGIYQSNASFKGYASSLLGFLEASRGLDKAAWPVALPDTGLPPFALSVALGRFAKEGTALPAAWAYAWFLSNGTIRKRSCVERCPDLFKVAFLSEFVGRYPKGLPLPNNKTRLRFSHRTASATLNGDLHSVELDLPDVSVLSAPVAKLQEIGDAAAAHLEAYSRFIGRNPDQANSLDGVVLLPSEFWPAPFRDLLAAVKSECAAEGRPKAMRLIDLQLLLPESQVFTKARYSALCRALQGADVGIEPDIQFGGTIPDIQDPIALFELPKGTGGEQPSHGFNSASLLLHLAAAVAGSDGTFGNEEAEVLLHHIQHGLALPIEETRRLEARLQVFRKAPPPLTGLKRRIETLDPAAKTSIGNFLVHIVQADGVIDPSEVRALEKIYKQLGLSSVDLYSKLHEVASEPIVVRDPTETGTSYRIPARPPSVVPEPSLKLDMTKVAALKEDSARVSALLGAIFTEQQPESQPEAALEEEGPASAIEEEGTLPGLDIAHSGLLQVLLHRPQWTRAELEELCADRGLMIDGAIEQINDASFERFEEPMIEGDDPLDIRSDLIMETAV